MDLHGFHLLLYKISLKILLLPPLTLRNYSFQTASRPFWKKNPVLSIFCFSQHKLNVEKGIYSTCLYMIINYKERTQGTINLHVVIKVLYTSIVDRTFLFFPSPSINNLATLRQHHERTMILCQSSFILRAIIMFRCLEV